MITRKQVESKYPNVVLDKLPDDSWNLLNSAMADDDWNSVDCELQPREDIARFNKQ